MTLLTLEIPPLSHRFAELNLQRTLNMALAMFLLIPFYLNMHTALAPSVPVVSG